MKTVAAVLPETSGLKRPRHIWPVVTTRPAKTKILTIPGLWSVGMNEQWSMMQPQLDRTVVPMALRGRITGIPGCLSDVSLMDYVDDVHHALERYGPSIIMGHSAGGYVGQILCTLYPDLVKGLILLASSMPRAKRVRGPKMQRRFFKWRYIYAMLTGNEYSLYPEDVQFVQGRTQVKLGFESGRVTREVLFRRFKIKQAKCPVLVIAPSNDQFVDRYQQRDLATFHGGNLEVMDGDHMFHCDQEPAKKTSGLINTWIHQKMV